MVVIKNIPTIVGSDADHVDLVDEATFASADTVDTIVGHAVETDNLSVSVDHSKLHGGLLQDGDTFFEADVINVP